MPLAKQGFVELTLPAPETQGKRRSILGGTVVGDYVVGKTRTVVIKTKAPEARAEAPKKSHHRARPAVTRPKPNVMVGE
jgi:hypothetical protein